MFVCLCLFWLRQVLVKDPSEKAGVQIGSHSGGYKQQGREKGHSNGQKGEGDSQHSDAGWKMAESHDQSIVYSMPDAVVKVGQQRVNVEIGKDKGHEYSHKKDEKSHRYHVFIISPIIDREIGEQKEPCCQRQEPHDGGLSEIFTEGPKEGGGKIPLLNRTYLRGTE